MRTSIVAAFLLFSCAAAHEGELAGPDETHADLEITATIPDEPPTSPPTPPRDRASALSEDDILLQLDTEPTFMARTTCNAAQSFGRMAGVTLYRDGTVIYWARRAGRAFVARHGERVATRHLQHVLDLGFETLEGFEEGCKPTDQGRLCISDAGVVILRAREPGGELRTLRNYAGWALEGEARLHAMYDRLALLVQPPAWGNEPYRPERATLCIASWETARFQGRETLAWPLDRALLDGATNGIVTVAIGRDDIERLVESGAPFLVDTLFEDDGDVFAVAVVPWLPGVDHSAEIAEIAEIED